MDGNQGRLEVLTNLLNQVVFDNQKDALKWALNELKGCEGCIYEECNPYTRPCSTCKQMHKNNRREYD